MDPDIEDEYRLAYILIKYDWARPLLYEYDITTPDCVAIATHILLELYSTHERTDIQRILRWASKFRIRFFKIRKLQKAIPEVMSQDEFERLLELNPWYRDFERIYMASQFEVGEWPTIIHEEEESKGRQEGYETASETSGTVRRA